MKKFKPLAASLLLVAGSIAVSCSSDSNDSTPTENLSTANSIDDLNMSGLNLNLPDSVTQDSASLSIGGKSREACEIGRVLGEGLSSLEQVASMFCHLEVEADKMSFGTKYALDFAGGEESGMAIWVDNTNIASGSLKISMCQNNELAQVITLTGVGSNSAKGSIVDHGSEQGSTWGASVKFDLGYTTPGSHKLYSATKFTSNGEAFRQQLSINIEENGVSIIKVSEDGTWQGDTFSAAGTAKLGSENGQVLFTNQMTGSYNETWVRRAYFNSAGNVVASDATTDFAVGGSLFVADSEVPDALSADFQVEGFASDEWDCSTDETVEINMEGERGAAHDQCDANSHDFYTDCHGGGYEEGTADSDFDDDARQDSDAVDTL